MIIIELLSWWFTSGWGVFIDKLKDNFSSLADFFSISSLLRTLFQPYRQISAGAAASDASLETKFHAFTDRLISRCIGFFSRLFLLIAGMIVMSITGIIGLVTLIAWPLIPFVPIAGIILTLTGFTIWTTNQITFLDPIIPESSELS